MIRTRLRRAEPDPDEPVLSVEGVTKVYEHRIPRWERILLPWSRVDSGRGDFDDEEDEDDEDDDDDEPIEVHDGKRALDGVSFSILPGETIALVGRPGAGRRTLLRIIAGLAAPTAGRVAHGGRVASSPSMVRSLGLKNATPRGTAVAMSRFMGGSPRLARRRLGDILELAGLGGLSRRELNQLSGVAKSRLIVATGLSLRPAVLIVDDRLDADDELRRRWLARIAKDRERRGLAVLLRAEDLDFAEQIADRVLWLDDGVVREFGEAGEVLSHFREALVHEAEVLGTHVDGPLNAAEIVQAPEADGVRIEADVELSLLPTLVGCALELRGPGRGVAVIRKRWRVEQEGVHRVVCAVPDRWLSRGPWFAILTIRTSELHGTRRAAQQELEFTVADDGADPQGPLAEVARWTLLPPD